MARGSRLARSARSAASVVLRARDELEEVGDRIGADGPGSAVPIGFDGVETARALPLVRGGMIDWSIK